VVGGAPRLDLEPYLMAVEGGALRFASWASNLNPAQRVATAQVGAGVVAAVAALLGIAGVLRLLLYIILLVAGLVGGVIFVSFPLYREVKKSKMPLPPRGVNPEAIEAATSPPHRAVVDKRMTGHKQVDDEITMFLDLAFRDYIHYWFDSISADAAYPVELRKVVQHMMTELSLACRQVDFVSLFTETYVDIFVGHLTLYRKAKRELIASRESSPRKGKGRRFRPRSMSNAKSAAPASTRLQSRGSSGGNKAGPVDDEALPTLDELFFRDDPELKGVCTDEEHEKVYCRDLAEVLLFALLPEDLFDEAISRTMLREMLASSSIKLSMDIFSDPDYMNSSIAMGIANGDLSFGDVQDAASHCTPEELEIIIENIDVDNKARTQERVSSADGENSWKHHREINDLLALRGDCKKLLAQRLAERAEAAEEAAATFTCEEVMSFEDAREVFREYLTNDGRVIFLDFLNAVGELRREQRFSASDIAECTDEVSSSVGSKARAIFAKFLAPNVKHRIALPDDVYSDLAAVMQAPERRIDASEFNAARKHVDWHVTTACFNDFKSSELFEKCSDILTAANVRPDAACLTRSVEGSGVALPTSAPGSPDNLSADGADSDDAMSVTTFDTDSVGSLALPGLIEGGKWETALVQAKQADAGHFMYDIQVRHTDVNGDRSQWMTSRRFSEFDNLNKKLMELFPVETKRFKLELGGKKIFGNKAQSFIKKRGDKLVKWLGIIVSPEFLQAANGAEKVVAKFLWQGAYEKVGLKLTSRVPLARKLRRRGSSDAQSSQGDADGEEDQEEGHESMPVQILLKVFSEIFELQNKGYMSRSIKNILVRFLKGLFGNELNKVVTDAITNALQPKQVAAFWKNQREVVWWPLPEGVLAPESPVRPKDCQVRTRLEARAKLFAILPTVIKDFVGAGTARRGVTDLFEMLQSRELNRRLLYKVLEATLDKMFPTLDFEKAYEKMHKSSTTSLESPTPSDIPLGSSL